MFFVRQGSTSQPVHHRSLEMVALSLFLQKRSMLAGHKLVANHTHTMEEVIIVDEVATTDEPVEETEEVTEEAEEMEEGDDSDDDSDDDEADAPEEPAAE